MEAETPQIWAIKLYPYNYWNALLSEQCVSADFAFTFLCMFFGSQMMLQSNLERTGGEYGGFCFGRNSSF